MAEYRKVSRVENSLQIVTTVAALDKAQKNQMMQPRAAGRRRNLCGAIQRPFRRLSAPLPPPHQK